MSCRSSSSTTIYLTCSACSVDTKRAQRAPCMKLLCCSRCSAESVRALRAPCMKLLCSFPRLAESDPGPVEPSLRS
ncbi:hypothetical protein M011DRAFT_266505 [Sporormia fimetaria CBS 119925]|uniref:Uncharacterized protein n=1 Tax=Sporormia fimetaria CBS 119925 TaxID=1340428 RepID=A0A6A6UYW2_9PLEO|nr:hypothetical protein M011DRAFT_266505 [Sporormia fimetaria CBS 119925]